ncbi:MAG: DegT/DnrJ/EryC1/StrS family aminotransferase [Candidatus Omnitrophica bacterium]|nr:DegT/DnrJ/EryC1/StrS family aminotransferase [Candidatus Omnitrophota bacterium]
MKIPLCKTNINTKESRAIEKVLKSGWLTDGPMNAKFEEAFAKYIGVKRALTLNSCTAALQLAMEASGITGEIILPSFTFVASANAAVKAGATPVFADIEYDTCNIDPIDIARKITPRTQAIMVVHYAGQACSMGKITKLAALHKLKIIEDSAETIGGTYKKQKTGSFSIGCFSFFPTKNITTGEGGMLTTNDRALADKIKTLAGHGITKNTYDRQYGQDPWFREASYAGYNFRMSGILAAIGIEQLKKLDAMNARRREHAAYLNKKLKFDEIDLPVELKECRHVYQMYTIKVKKVARRDFVLGLRKKGIMASVHFTPPVHLQQYYARKYKRLIHNLPVTERVANSIATLPMYPGLTKKELDYMINSVGKVLRSLKRRTV